MKVLLHGGAQKTCQVQDNVATLTTHLDVIFISPPYDVVEDDEDDHFIQMPSLSIRMDVVSFATQIVEYIVPLVEDITPATFDT